MQATKSRKPSKREIALASMRVAGYHNDSREYIRLVVESRVNRQAMNDAWRAGVRDKAAGVSCNCLDCKKGAA